MGTRALAVLLLVPSLAAAQTAGVLTANPLSVGRATCATTSGPFNVTLSWTINTANTGGSALASDKYRIAVYASTDTCPAPASAPATGAVNVLGADTTAAGSTDSRFVYSGAIAAAGNVACPTTTASVSDAAKKLCVYLVDSAGTPKGSNGAAAEGPFTFQLARPPPPVLDSVSPANGALFVYFHAGTPTGLDTATTDHFEVHVYLGGTLVATASNAQNGVRVGGLSNTAPNNYTVTVVAFSSGGNVSADSNSLPGTPVPFVDFWTAYQADGGREQGGCGGGAGPLSALALLPLALRRRRR